MALRIRVAVLVGAAGVAGAAGAGAELPAIDIRLRLAGAAVDPTARPMAAPISPLGAATKASASIAAAPTAPCACGCATATTSPSAAPRPRAASPATPTPAAPAAAPRPASSIIPTSAAMSTRMVDLTGLAYSALPNAFKYRQTLVPSCRCRPQPWSETELQRHRAYAQGLVPESPRRLASCGIERRTSRGRRSPGRAAAAAHRPRGLSRVALPQLGQCRPTQVPDIPPYRY